jgi:hypothetical protein
MKSWHVKTSDRFNQSKIEGAPFLNIYLLFHLSCYELLYSITLLFIRIAH